MRNGASLIAKLKKKKEQNTNKSGRDYLFKFVTTILEIVSLILTLPSPPPRSRRIQVCVDACSNERVDNNSNLLEEYQLRFGGNAGMNGSKSLNNNSGCLYSRYIDRFRCKQRGKRKETKIGHCYENCSICINNRTLYKLMVIVIHCRQSLVFSRYTQEVSRRFHYDTARPREFDLDRFWKEDPAGRKGVDEVSFVVQARCK